MPVRTCVGCRATAPQRELVRVAVVEGRAVVDLERRQPGRGAWVHPRPACLAGAGRGGLARSFRSKVAVARDDLEGLAGIAMASGQGRADAVESSPVPRTDTTGRDTTGGDFPGSSATGRARRANRD